MSPPARSYVLCSTPRTGSTLLCSLLQSTGCAGRPESYFRAQDYDSRAAAWGILQPDGSVAFQGYLDCVLNQGTSANGLFAVRIMWETLSELIDRLQELGLSGSDQKMLEQAFGPVKFVYLHRRDRLAQAISRLRAEQTNVWHVTSRSDLASADSADVTYDRERLEQFVAESESHNAAWASWFERNRVDPLRVEYEDLAENGDRITRRVLSFVGAPSPAAPTRSPNLRMADALSLEWAARFRAETGYAD